MKLIRSSDRKHPAVAATTGGKTVATVKGSVCEAAIISGCEASGESGRQANGVPLTVRNLPPKGGTMLAAEVKRKGWAR